MSKLFKQPLSQKYFQKLLYRQMKTIFIFGLGHQLIYIVDERKALRACHRGERDGRRAERRERMRECIPGFSQHCRAQNRLPSLFGESFCFFFLTVFPGMLCSFREPQGPLSGLGLMRQNTALSRDGKALSVFSIDARELSFGEKMGYF